MTALVDSNHENAWETVNPKLPNQFYQSLSMRLMEQEAHGFSRGRMSHRGEERGTEAIGDTPAGAEVRCWRGGLSVRPELGDCDCDC